MLTRIGTNACNKVFHSSFCNQPYGATAGFAILTGTAILGLVILNRLYRPAEDALRALKTRWVEYHWQRLKGFFEEAGHPLSSQINFNGDRYSKEALAISMAFSPKI